jgi:hypothetical protein
LRSIREVFIHVAGTTTSADALGRGSLAEKGIDAKGTGKTVKAFEKRTMKRGQIFAELEESLEFLKRAMADMPESRVGLF